MELFVVIGVVGAAALLASLVFGDVLEGVFDAIGIDVAGGLLSLPVLAGFATAFGFGTALVLGSTSAGLVLALPVGVAAGVLIGGAALWITRALLRMRTDEPVRTGDLVGKQATVVTPIPDGGLGEVLVHHAGQQLKLSARCDQPIAARTSVVVVGVSSSSSVVVEPEASFWSDSVPKELP